MKKNLLFLLIMFSILILHGALVIVDINGGGNCTSIQLAIDSCVDGDTIVVCPGRYFENINYMGKTLRIGSLAMTNGNPEFIHSTIIDGNQTGSCVIVNQGEEYGTTLWGFTLCNGSGTPDPCWINGGGVYVSESSLNIAYCIIENNTAEFGGGLCIVQCDVNLVGSTIRNNDAKIQGGGILCAGNDGQLFSTKTRCNVYDNFAPVGLDIFNSLYTGDAIDVKVDTFTVLNPKTYEFFQAGSSYAQDYSNSEIDIWHPKYERVREDLYVSPLGSDENSGLTINDPLQTINQALHVITADEENPLTIHLASGIYSTLLNNQKFPISLRAYVSIEGVSTENTIMDLGIEHQGFSIDIFSDRDYALKNFTVRNVLVTNADCFYHSAMYSPNWYLSDGHVLLENINFIDNQVMQLIFICTMNITFRNVNFYNNYFGSCCELVHGGFYSNNMDVVALFENCRFENNPGGHIFFEGNNNPQTVDCSINFVDCDFFNCDRFYYDAYSSVGVCVNCRDLDKVNIINSTFGDNDCEGEYLYNAPIYLSSIDDINIVNNIIYGNNTDYSLLITGADYINVHHNIIENGFDGLFGSAPQLIWDYDTVYDLDPIYLYEPDYFHQLHFSSPAIEMGTLDLPEGIVLPEYDLAGNDRIMGYAIDLGAYEFIPWGVDNDEILPSVANDLIIYPNPFVLGKSRSNEIKFLWNSESVISDPEFDIYNIKGQKVKSLTECNEIQTGRFEASWDMTDINGAEVGTGIYFICLKTFGNVLEISKFIIMK